MFDGSGNSDFDGEREGEYIYSPVLGLALEWVIDELIQTSRTGGYPRALIGSTVDMPTDGYQEHWSFDLPAHNATVEGETQHMRAFRMLLANGTRKSSRSIQRTSSEAYINFVRTKFNTVLIPYNKANYHYVLFEINFMNREQPYLYVWDSMDMWADYSPTDIPQIQTLLSAFFHPGEKVAVKVSRELNTPYQGSGHGCAAFVFFTAAFRAFGLLPPRATVKDEAFMRNYMWGCIVAGKMLPLPELKPTKP